MVTRRREGGHTFWCSIRGRFCLLSLPARPLNQRLPLSVKVAGGDFFPIIAYAANLHDTKEATVDNRTTLLEGGVQRCGVEHDTHHIILRIPASAACADFDPTGLSAGGA